MVFVKVVKRFVKMISEFVMAFYFSFLKLLKFYRINEEKVKTPRGQFHKYILAFKMPKLVFNTPFFGI